MKRDIGPYILIAIGLSILLVLLAIGIKQSIERADIADACTQLGGVPVEHYNRSVVCIDASAIKKP